MFLTSMLLPFSLCLISASLVVPVVVTTALPLSWPMSLMPESALTSILMPVTNVVSPNDTCFCRSTLLVVDPHSRSIVPFCISVIRFCDVTGL